MKAEHTVASYNGRDFTSKIATVYSPIFQINTISISLHSSLSNISTRPGVFTDEKINSLSIFFMKTSKEFGFFSTFLHVYVSYLFTCKMNDDIMIKIVFFTFIHVKMLFFTVFPFKVPNYAMPQTYETYSRIKKYYYNT
jgi:hypothetical protein